MIDGLKFVRRICTTAPLSGYVVGEEYPGAKVQSDDELLDFVRQAGETVFHPTSTCSIGPVVDDKLRVKGLGGLRVVDASVMPSVPSGNINASVIAVAEKAADLIKAGD
jgi:choline dehydrogenase